MEHVEIKSAWLHLLTPDPLKLYLLDFGITKMRCELAISREMQEKYLTLSGTASFFPSAQARNFKPSIDTWTDADPRKNEDYMKRNMAATHQGNVRHMGAGDTIFMLKTRIEQAPNPESRVTLDTEKDALGMPRAILRWALTPFEKRSIRKLYELIGQQTGLAGVGRVQLMEYLQDPSDDSWPEFTSGGWHHMGTTRMSDDPRTGVVDGNGKVHGIANLFVAGASCFVTAAAPNPTLTIVALSLRLSDHLKRLAGIKG
jgi:choline dehydrogenase-like flavoprotein